MVDKLPKAARDLLRTIDLQLTSIEGNLGQDSDLDFALREQRSELEEWRQQILDEPKQARLRKQAECGTCLEVNPKGDMLKMQCCNARYCKSCFQEWVQGFVNAQELPKCCDTEIVVAKAPYRFYLDKETKKKHKGLKRELDAKRKLWCSNKSCGKLINSDIDPVEGFVTCTACRKKTCATCAKAVEAHKGRQLACEAYIKDEELNDAVEKNNLKRCPRCHIPVEKTLGCNNIRCRCGVLFCYVCGISKAGEYSDCKCSNPALQVNEIVENPTGDEWQAPVIVSDPGLPEFAREDSPDSLGGIDSEPENFAPVPMLRPHVRHVPRPALRAAEPARNAHRIERRRRRRVPSDQPRRTRFA